MDCKTGNQSNAVCEYFTQIKAAVAKRWDPNTPLRQRDPSGLIYGGINRYTLLSVTLDKDGALTAVSVDKSCGLDFLDQAAVAAFKQAQPFSNPPSELIAKDNTLRSCFGFFVKPARRGP